MEPKLEDFFEYYPEQTDPEFASKIANYYEFQECSSGREDVKIEGDTFYTHQRAYQRLGRVVDRIALIAEAGVGKSRCNICLADYLRENRLSRKNYFITGRSLIGDYNSQLVSALAEIDEASAATSVFKSARTQPSQLSLLQKTSRSAQAVPADVYTKGKSKSLKEFNEVLTYDEFVKRVLALTSENPQGTKSKKKVVVGDRNIDESNRRINEEFAGCSFFFDEIQFQKITSDNIGKNEGKDRQRHVFYWTIWRFCHVVEQARITIASARPLTNEPQEFAYALNWILPLDNQIPLKRNFQDEGTRRSGLKASYGHRVDWKSLSENSTSKDLAAATEYYMEALEPYLRGRVMFIAAAYTGVDISYLPAPNPYASAEVQLQIAEERSRQAEALKSAKTPKEKNQANQRLLPMKMKEDGSPDIQAQTYLDYINRQDKGGRQVGQRKPTEILTVAFPKVLGKESEENWGISGMKQWMTDNGAYREGVVSAENGKGLRWYLKNRLDSLSVSMAYIRNVAVNYPWKGYVFSDLVEGSGLYFLGHVFEEGGNVFLKDKYYDKPFERYVPQEFNAELVPKGALETRFRKAPRYAIISSEAMKHSPTAMTKVLALYNHPDNIHGEYLKYIFISKKGMTGINLMHVMHVFSLFLSHNPSDLYQAIRRAIRAVSHHELRKLWLESPRYRDYPFEVTVNLLSTVFLRGTGKSTISTQIFTRTLNKDLNIAPVMRTYKQLSATAWIFEKRNNLGKKFSGTAEADYMSATLAIPGSGPDDVIYTNYLLLYAKEKIEAKALVILAKLRKENEYDIRNSLASYNDKLELAIYQLAIASLLVTNDYDITDSFGFRCDVVLFDSILYLHRRYSVVPQREFCSYYTSSLITVESKSLPEIIDEMIESKINAIYKELPELENTEEAVSEYLGAMKIEQKALFFESIIARVYSGDLNEESEEYEIIKTILDLLRIDLDKPEKSGNYFDMEEPIDEIQNISKESVEQEEKSHVYVHNIYVYVRGTSGAGKISRTSGAIGRLRIFRLAEGKWRDAREDESEVYRGKFRELNYTREKKMNEKSMIYGRVSEGETKFWIIDKYLENKFAGGNEIREGTATLARKIDAIAYMWHFGYRYDPHSLRDHHPELFTNMSFQLRPEELKKAVEYEASLTEEGRKNLQVASEIEYAVEQKLLRDVQRTYSGEYTKAVIVHALRERMIIEAIKRARRQLWEETDRRIEKKVNQTFFLKGVLYSFDPRLPSNDPSRATSQMVAFFYHYLSSQSAAHGYPKPKLIKMIAVRMFEQGLVFSDTLPKPAIRRIIENLNIK